MPKISLFEVTGCDRQVSDNLILTRQRVTLFHGYDSALAL